MAIKWRKQDLQKLAIYSRKFNAAITRFEKSAPDLIGTGVIPERIDTQELKSRIMNRKDFNRELRKIDRFFKPGARDIIRDKAGFSITRWQNKELQYLQQRINAQNRAYIKKYNVPKHQIDFLGLNEVNLMKDKSKIFSEAGQMEDFEDQMNKLQEWYNLAYTLERQSSEDYLVESFAKLRSAYINGIREHMPPDKAEELIQWLKDNNIWGTDIVWATAQNDVLDFEYFYNTEDELARAEVMIDRWKQVLPLLKEQSFYKNKRKKGERV